MSREVRRVPEDWQHPKELNWDRSKWIFRALFEGSQYERNCKSAIEYQEDPPSLSDFMPVWTKEEATHWQMYETCSEGTPISPVMESPEKLGEWLVANSASTFGTRGMNTASLETWMGIILEGDEPFLMWTSDEGLHVEVK